MPGNPSSQRQPTRSTDSTKPVLTDDHHMLLDIRDTLYDGDWKAFARDLIARAQSRPHVFEILPASDDLVSTIRHHLALIEEMSAWEASSGRRLAGRTTPGADEESAA